MARTMDLTEGSILKKMLIFSLPLIAGNLLQQFYTVADRIVVGRFAADGATALAAVGATAQPVNLVLGFFLGIATGASVICSNMLGSGDKAGLRKNMHTAVLLALLCGVAMSVITIPLVEVFLRWLGTPESVLGSATRYMQLYMLGVPASLVYNVAAGIFRAHGDTKRPMYVLSLSGLVNVALNLVLVIGFHLDVVGVAIATVVSQYLSAGALTWVLFNAKDQYALTWKELRLNKKQVGEILRVGIPSGLGGIVFSASNLTIQTAVNSFNSTAINSGHATGASIESFIYMVGMAMQQTSANFIGQNVGAKNYRRLRKIGFTCLTCVVVFYALAGSFVYIFGEPLLGLYIKDSQEAIQWGMLRFSIICPSMVLCAVMDVMGGSLRGLGKATTSMLMSVLGVCGIRLVWVNTVFRMPQYHTMQVLYYSFPISWGITMILQLSAFVLLTGKMIKQWKQEEQQALNT